MKKLPHWGQPWLPIHLIGPIPGTNLNLCKFFANDQRISKLEEDDYHLYGGLAVLSSPKEDMEKISGKEEEVLASLPFILETGDVHTEIEREGDPNPLLGNSTDYLDEKKPASYGTSLRVLERLAEEGLTFGILPNYKGSEVSRYRDPRNYDQDLPLLPTIEARLAKKEGVKLLLGEEKGTFERKTRNGVTLHCFANIGVEITTPEKTQEHWINAQKPFVAYLLTEECNYEQNPTNWPEFLCNEAFIAFSKKNPKGAESQMIEALSDGFFHHEQNSDQRYYDWDMFLQDTPLEMETFWDKTRQRKKSQEEFQKEIESLFRKFLYQTCPEAEPLLTESWRKGTKVHLKYLQIKGGKITFNTTIETEDTVLKIQGNPEVALEVTKTQRNRKPTNLAAKTPTTK